MYGTVGRVRIKKEKQQEFLDTIMGQPNDSVAGFKQAFVMFPENREGEAILVAMFEDRDSYWKNANDPAQDERYREFSKYFEGEPEWSDGEWLSS
jgi:hypothetical protein